MLVNPRVFVVNGSATARAVADVLAVLLGGESICGSPEDIPVCDRARCELLVLACMDGIDQIRALPHLRLRGYGGPVLIVSEAPLEDLKDSHRIVRSADGAREAFNPTRLLPELLSKSFPLEPLGNTTLRHLQELLVQRRSYWEEKLLGSIGSLDSERTSFLEGLNDLETVFGDLRTAAPLATHADDMSFRRLVDDIRQGGQLTGDHEEALKMLIERVLGRLCETAEVL